MVRIIQIGPYPLSSDCVKGGIESSVYGLVQEQIKSSEVVVFDLPRLGEEDREEMDGNVKIHRFKNKGRRQLGSILRVNHIANMIFSTNPTVCHIHGTGLFSFLLYKKLRRKKLKTFVTVHGLLHVEKKKKLSKNRSAKALLQYVIQTIVEKSFLSSMSEAIVDTGYVKDAIGEYSLCRFPQTIIIPQGINERYYSLNCSETSNIIVCVGTISERKGHLQTIAAFEKMNQKGVDAVLVLAGSVAERGYLFKVEEKIKNSFCKDSISLLTDLPQKSLFELYEKAHLFVLHSEEESQGIVLAEAMATGLPVVATNVGGIPYVVSDGENGLLSDYGDVESFANNMQSLMTNIEKWKEMSASSKQMSEQYHWSSIKNRIDSVYNLVRE